MGIRGLYKLLEVAAPGAVQSRDCKEYDMRWGRRVAVDAMVYIEQALKGGPPGPVLRNGAGKVTSHLQGVFMRTARLLQAGILPVYVFDGEPPRAKDWVLRERRQERMQAEEELKAAREAGDLERVEKLSKRVLQATPEQYEQCKRLLRLMGVPVVQAPGEAEATCARMQAGGLVFAVCTEDSDALPFGTKRLVRHMKTSKDKVVMGVALKKNDVLEIDLESALRELDLSMPEFIDLCILLGCDYCKDKIHVRPGSRPVHALKLMREHRSIENLVAELDPEKYKVPEGYLESVKRAREVFSAPDVAKVKGRDLKWGSPDREGLLKFLVEENQFPKSRVLSTLAQLDRLEDLSQRLEGLNLSPPLIVDMKAYEYKDWLENEMEAIYRRPYLPRGMLLKQNLIRVAVLISEQWDLAQEKYGPEMSFARFKRAVARCGVHLRDGTVFDSRSDLAQHLRRVRGLKTYRIKSIGRELGHDKQYLPLLQCRMSRRSAASAS